MQMFCSLNSFQQKGGDKEGSHGIYTCHVSRLCVHAALRDLGFSREGEMETLSQGRTARLRAAVDRYEAIDFEEPLQKRVKKTASKCARQYRMPRPSHGLPPISIALRQYTSNQRYIHENVSAHARAHSRTPNHPHSNPPEWKGIAVL